MSDSGHSLSQAQRREKLPDGYVDPLNLHGTQSPSAIDLTTGTEDLTVGDVDVISGGWLRVRLWDGTTREYPPHMIRCVERLAVDGSYDDEGYYDGRVEDLGRIWDDLPDATKELIAR